MARRFLMLLAALAATACAPARESGQETRQAVSDLVQRWSDAGEAGDWDAVADTYADAEGFVWIEQGEPRYTSRRAILAGLAQARAMSASIRNDVSDIVVTPLGPGTAAFRARYVLEVSGQGMRFTSTGVLSGVAIRQGGAWRFLNGAFSERPAGGG